ncbi:MAG: hypothetical protein DWQ02_06845 [Bacteroidetes bacterium]|nr:MAG: hypothetical protein DWQ02_06845 [Bacteroidota bacterium]
MSIEAYAQKEQKKMKLADEAYQKHLTGLMGKPENWLVTEFAQDDDFRSELKNLDVQSLQAELAPEQFDKWEKELQTTHPRCAVVISPFVLSMMK